LTTDLPQSLIPVNVTQNANGIPVSVRSPKIKYVRQDYVVSAALTGNSKCSEDD